ncbi:MAG: hypothetical protein U0842_14515 [Candidatus Binatia bacterium]
MWMQAQNLVVAGAFEWDGSVVMVLVLGLLLVSALGVLVESGAFTAALDWLMGDDDRRPARIAATPQRSRA